MSKAAGFAKGHGPGEPAPEKFQLHPGDVEWTKPPKGVAKGPAMGPAKGKQRVNASADDGPRATVKGLNPGQKRDLAKRIKAKLRKRPKA